MRKDKKGQSRKPSPVKLEDFELGATREEVFAALTKVATRGENGKTSKPSANKASLRE